jgi:hypothetical protein
MALSRWCGRSSAACMDNCQGIRRGWTTHLQSSAERATSRVAAAFGVATVYDTTHSLLLR